MIDSVSLFAKKYLWSKPLFLLVTIASLCTFGYVIFSIQGDVQDIYLIPTTLCLLWSLSCWLMLSFLPNVPSKISQQHSFILRLKNGIVRSGYYLFALIFILLTVLIMVLTIKLLGVWYTDFHL